MTFGRQPQDNRSQFNPQYGQPEQQQNSQPVFQSYQNHQAQGAQVPVGQNPNGQQYGYAAQPGSGLGPVDAQIAYSYERTRRVSVANAYGQMTLGLLVTAAVAIATQVTGALNAFLNATGMIGWIGLAVVQVVMAVMLGARIMKMKTGTAYAMFYIYAALMGFTLSSIFMVYDLGSIGVALLLSAGFFVALTMLALTTKIDMLKAGPILMVALLVLIVGQVILMFVAPSDGMIRLISAAGLLIFAGLTAYDAQRTRALFAQYATGTDTLRRISIICALSLYLDFVNMFLYLLRIFGSRN
ncbi:Bax inhibitor-1/YccA family protein [Bifidobacterium sp.]|jgi:FtsH-binding integral membrane protein|uniref:Bax inhibitor-1/YccA family protein n=1 Tax=Bifidobacterium sp. TaxID=41200 RepID=UPI0025BC433C|nr:Bax inhibitor-1/YccA family protein [Bifidobacterium sp.]MCI1225488.1 Bax inhibitor-1/YccA family protein [Bifidobacterium sp.]